MRIRETLNLLRDSSVWAPIGHTGHFGLLEVKRTRNFSLSRNYLETPPPTSFFMGIRETLNLLPDSSLWGLIRHLGHLGLPEVKRTRTFSLSRNCLETHPPSSFFVRIRKTFGLLRHSSVWAPIGRLCLHAYLRSDVHELFRCLGIAWKLTHAPHLSRGFRNVSCAARSLRFGPERPRTPFGPTLRSDAHGLFHCLGIACEHTHPPHFS